jgi:25S rRNA (uracil2634-N3)-methyltransferase
MPRKKQKSGPPPRSHRPSGPAKPGPGPGPGPASQGKNKSSKPDIAAGRAEAGAGKEGIQNKQSLQANQRPIVPFLRGDRILLIGEGKLSFLILGAWILGFWPFPLVSFCT